MEELFSLVNSLTTSEWQSLQSYLTCFSTHDPAQVKQLHLAKLLREVEVCPTDKFCSIKIYGTKWETSFDVLKSRLKDKTLDFLLTDISSDKKLELDEADYAIMKMKKKSAQFQQLFYSKRRIPLLDALLDEIISLAKEYEQYSVLVDSLRFKKTIIGSKRGKEEFEKVNKEMKYGWQCSKIYNDAEHYYSELMMLGDYSGKLDKQKTLLFLKNAITEVHEGYELTKSPMIDYYLKMLEMAFYQLNENRLKARSVCLELLDVVRNNKSVYRRQRLGVVYDNLSHCEFYLNHFKEAAECAREAQKHFNLNSENYCIALEQEFYALFAMKQYDTAIEIANKMIASATRKELGEFRFSKYNYLLANALFKQRRFTEALQLLSQERELSKDKAGWETGARVLKIMTLIEMLKLDEASLAVLSLKQFFKYTEKKSPISMRDKKILNLLLIAERAGFSFSLLNGNTTKYLSPLTSSDEKVRWEPFTHEVIPFHEWFAEKMKMKKPLPVSFVKEERKKQVRVY